MIGVIGLSLQSCNDLLGELYDEPLNDTQYGFIKTNEIDNSGTIYIDATKYTQWIYIDFHNRSIDSLEINSGQDEPTEWDIAVHRYDAKTNGGSVLETGYNDLNLVQSLESLPEGEFIEDGWSKVTIDMSDMINDNIIYADSYVNTELSKWLDVDTGTMPPVYTLSSKVYLVRLEDGTLAAVRLSDFMSKSGVKGYMTIDYIYPLNI